MSKMKVIFWSQSGNTEAMANAVAEGIKEAGREAEAVFVTEVTPDSIKDDSSFALGCPAMGAEVLEENDMEPFVECLEAICNGKNIALFGSYGWGDGQWMRDWTDRLAAAGANVLNGEGLICQNAPDESVLNECRELGKQLAGL